MSREEAPTVPQPVVSRNRRGRARAHCTRCGRFLPAGAEGLCARCRTAPEHTAHGESPLAAGLAIAPGEATPSGEERTTAEAPPVAMVAPTAASREEVIRRTRTEFVVARPSELHPDLRTPDRPATAAPEGRGTTRTRGSRARRFGRILSWGDGLLVVVIVAVLFAALIAYWLSPTP